MTYTTTEPLIWEALRKRIAALVTTPALPMAWPNVDFTPPAAGYLHATQVPNTTQRLFIGSGEPHRRLGLLQIDVFGEINKGLSLPSEIAGQVAAWFPDDLRLTEGGIMVRITKWPSINQATRDGAFWMVPVTIEYEVIH